MIKLFISYRSLDSAKVDTLVARMKSLKDADDKPLYSIWQDKTSILAGQDWWQAIVQGIIDCDVFVFMVSGESVKNINCRDELTYARKRNRPIIPIVLEDEFYYNPAKDKDDLDYWGDMPSELNDNRFQFLFYDGNQSKFINGLNAAVDRLMAMRLKDIPADFPADPRDATSNDTIRIYDEACDYALRLEFETARVKFQRLIGWNDALFAADAHDWMVLLYQYEKMLRLDARQSTRHHIPPLWTHYAAQFPKSFIDLFDPKDFKSRYKGKSIQTEPPVESKIDTSNRQSPQFEEGQSKSSHLPSISLDELLNYYPSKIEIARAFKGTKNSDWTPIFQTFEVHGIKFEMCLVPPGSFMIGSDDGYDSEKPVHKQTLTEPYWIGVHPVTNAQWRTVVTNSNGAVKVPAWANWYKDNRKSNHPVVGVTWYQCIEFLKWLGTEWRLPTEPQWEYAARGLDNLVYPFGNEFKPDLVVYSENSNKSTAAVGARPKGASWVGAQDMSGNVWEWTDNVYQSYPYKAHDWRKKIISNPTWMLRGGSWNRNHDNARAASRNFLPYHSSSHPDKWDFSIGFRCVCPPSL
jgi:toxoflavin biosynthesis protein ToxD